MWLFRALGFGLLFLAILALLAFVLWLWALIDMLASKLNPAEKLLWLIILIFLNLLGAVLYFIFANRREFNKVEHHKGSFKRLFRSRENRVIAGVCGGLGEYFNIDPTLIRLIWILVSLLSLGLGLFAYILAWIIMPERGK